MQSMLSQSTRATELTSCMTWAAGSQVCDCETPSVTVKRSLEKSMVIKLHRALHELHEAMPAEQTTSQYY